MTSSAESELMHRQSIKCALLGGALALLCYTGLVAAYFSANPMGICCRWEGDNNEYWLFDSDGSFDRMLAERFPRAPRIQSQFRPCWYEWALLTWLELYGEPTAQKVPLAIFIGASCSLGVEHF
jgi:hypothetical protein